MISARIFIILIFFFSCNTEPIREEIEVGKTIKIESANFPFNDSYTYLWTKPYGPNNHNSSYSIENNKMLFTPSIAGKYNITLLVESFDKTKLYEENFLYTAIGEAKTILKDSNQDRPSTEEIQKISKPEENYYYTIQLASWPTVDRAQEHQNELREMGYDSYIEQFYIKNKDQIWWRVRVGHFKEKSKAEEVTKTLSNITGLKLWIDYID